MQDNPTKNTLVKVLKNLLLPVIALASGFLLNQFFSHTNKANNKIPLQLPNHKILLLNFWATWCPPCRKEIPDFVQLHSEFKDQGFSVVGLAIDKPEKVRAFEQEVGINYPSLVVEKEGYALMEEYGSLHGALPYTVILDRQGNIVHKHHKGILSYEQAKKLIEPLL